MCGVGPHPGKGRHLPAASRNEKPVEREWCSVSQLNVSKPWVDPAVCRAEMDEIVAMLAAAGRVGDVRTEIAALIAETS